MKEGWGRSRSKSNNGKRDGMRKGGGLTCRPKKKTQLIRRDRERKRVTWGRGFETGLSFEIRQRKGFEGRFEKCELGGSVRVWQEV